MHAPVYPRLGAPRVGLPNVLEQMREHVRRQALMEITYGLAQRTAALVCGCPRARQYTAAFSPEDGISTMTLLDSNLYLDEEWIAAQVRQIHTILIYSDQIGMRKS
jgi:hypothetical protein